MQFEGDWQVHATVPGGGTYDGTIAVARRGDAFELAWRISAGDYVGIGLEHEGAWYVACGERFHGLGLAISDAAGTLLWIDALDRRLRRATITPVTEEPMRGRVWGDAPFHGFVVQPRGGVHEADFEHASCGRGLAWPAGTGWALAWYPDFAQTVILRYARGRDDDALVGEWALGGHTEPARERLSRPAR